MRQTTFARLRFLIVALPLLCLALHGGRLRAVCHAEGEVYFVVNGQICDGGHCVLNTGSSLWSNPLLINLGGYLPGMQRVNFQLYATSENAPQLLKGFYPCLVHGVDRIRAGVGTLSLPFKKTVGRGGNGNTFLLHLCPPAIKPPNQIVTIFALDGESKRRLAQLTIVVEGTTPASALVSTGSQRALDLWSSSVRIQPSPDNPGQLKIDLRGLSKESTGTMEVIDLLGNVVLERTLRGGEVSYTGPDALPNGIYLVRVEINGVLLHTQRLVLDAPQRPTLPRRN